MKSNKRDYIILIYFLISLISIIFSIIYIQQYYGPLFRDPIYILVNLVGSLFIVVIIEFVVIYGFLRKADLINKDLFLSVLIVNLAIFLPIQTVAYLFLAFYIIYYPFYILAIFIIGLCLEWLLYRFGFRKLIEKKSLNKELSPKKIILISVLANLASGVLTNIYPGLILLIEFAKWPGLYP